MLSSRKKEKWVSQFTDCVEQSLGDPNLTATELARQMGISERQLFRNVKNYTGYTPNELINQIRFQKAYDCLQAGAFDTVAEIAAAVGFKDAGYFSKKFKERFGVSPSEV